MSTRYEVTAPAVPGPLTQREEVPSLQGYAHFIRRNRALLLLLTAAGALAGTALVVQSPPEYVATESVAVTPQPTGADIDPDRPSLVSLDSDAQILSSGDVLTRAAIATGFPGGAEALSDSLDVSARPNSRVLIVRITTDDRDLAVAATTAVVAEFLESRAATETERAASSAADLNAEIATLLERLGALDTRADASPTAPTAAQLAKNELVRRLADLEDQLRLVTTAGAASPGTITKAASAPPGGARPMAAATLASGVLLGAMAGVGIATLAESSASSRLGRLRASQPERRVSAAVDA